MEKVNLQIVIFGVDTETIKTARIVIENDNTDIPECTNISVMFDRINDGFKKPERPSAMVDLSLTVGELWSRYIGDVPIEKVSFYYTLVAFGMNKSMVEDKAVNLNKTLLELWEEITEVT
jgi:hypothetical protein